MACPSASTGHAVLGVPVWANLTEERRVRVVRLLTELAHAFVTTPVKNSSKKVNCVDPSQTRQGSSRTP
jgi:hypothetical protein